jgi:putative phosphoesterase
MRSARIGILSDTHMPGSMPTLWDSVATAFAGVDLILHAGDIVLPMVLEQLEELAPVLAARGNNDVGWDDRRVADIQWLDVAGFRIAMVHDMEPEDEPIDVLRRKYLGGEEADVMVSGHTHFERIAWRDHILQVNPGSVVHPHLWSTRPGTVAVLDMEPQSLRARIVRLAERDGLRNPGQSYEFDGNEVRGVDAGSGSA